MSQIQDNILNDDDMLQLNYQATPSSQIIKVVGVGGGGGNAVDYMYRQGIHDVSFALCNTDRQALDRSGIPTKIQLGEGLGAGNRPEVAETAANESRDAIRQMFDDGTKMAFVTAGMGGGTGTGASPIVAGVAKEMGILTVGIVTIPFNFEGQKKLDQALDGIDKMGKNVDALLLISNQQLCSVYPDLDFMNAFAKADDTLLVAAKSIAEIITVHGKINLDFADVKTILKDGGIAIMSSGTGEGESRVSKSIQAALTSPLLNNKEVSKAKKILFNVYFSESSPISMREMDEISAFMKSFSKEVEVIWGIAVDNSLEKKVKMTVLATGFGLSEIRNDREGTAPVDIQEIIETVYSPFYIFNIDELDNNILIDALEQTPVVSRSKDFVSDVRQRYGVTQVKSNAPVMPKIQTQEFIAQNGVTITF